MFLPPGVSEAFAERSGWGFGYVTWDEVRALVKPRAEDAHKGMYGHALLVCGSRGMPGRPCFPQEPLCVLVADW